MCMCVCVCVCVCVRVEMGRGLETERKTEAYRETAKISAKPFATFTILRNEYPPIA